MIKIRILFIVAFLWGISIPVTAETYTITADSVYKHISVLAADSLEGRQVGEMGEWKAALYIKTIFSHAGLQPKGDDSDYLQSFPFVKRVDYGSDNRLTINGMPLHLYDDYIPLRQTVSTSFDFSDIIDVNYGITIDNDGEKYDDYKGKDVRNKAVLIKRYAPSSDDTKQINFGTYSSLVAKINNALRHHVAGIIFITPDDHDDTLVNIGPAQTNPKDIPILFLKRTALKKLGLDLKHPVISSAVGSTDVYKVHDTGYNVIGYVPGKSDTTIVIGAHYDHLGWGGPNTTSRYHGATPMIHNGADDNASGTAAVLELARYYASHPDEHKYSMLFIAFSGEEFGLLGSSYFVKHMTVDSGKVLMMLNLDMIGRLSEHDNRLAIMGVGTSPAFKDYFDSQSRSDVTLIFSKSGTEPSDQISFYNHDIPVLYFFTGVHMDYHMPTDDIDKIDAQGVVSVTNVIRDIITHFNTYHGTVAFQKTGSSRSPNQHASYSVTLGVMPDYMGEATGLRVENVVPGKPAEKAGIQKGDIIIQLGETKVGDIYDYMEALSKFKKGDTTKVTVTRKDKTVTMTVVF